MDFLQIRQVVKMLVIFTSTTHTYGKKLKQFAAAPLLSIDDFGLKPLKTPEDEDIHEVISRRYENGSMIITSNLAISNGSKRSQISY
jgi:DNA replication protein DnaC